MKRFFKKLDNRGASLVFTLLAVVVVLILAALILSLSLSNFKSKAVDNMSRENFYSVEQAANEMYAGIGSYAIDILGSSYATALSSISMAELDGTVTQVSTDKLNIFFREEYMVNVIQYMTGVTYARDSFFEKDATGKPNYATKAAEVYTQADQPAMFAVALTKLQQCLTKSDGVTVSIDGDLSFDYGKFVFILGDVHVEYEENGLLSKETFDMEIGFPDWELTFLANKGNLGDDFTNFALVGDTGLNFNANAAITGGIFGGGSAKTKSGMNTGVNGIRINNVEVSVNPNADGSGAVVTNGDITMKSTVTTGSKFVLGANGKLWCTNFVIPSNGSGNPDKSSVVNFGTGTKVYVKDDLEIYGDNADVTIAGTYKGYSFVSYKAVGNEEDGAPHTSSAIIVNGNKDKINIVSGANVEIAGNAYINITQSTSDATSYMTGESIALKTNQQAYMVPAAWMQSYTVGGVTKQLSNPVPTASFNEAKTALGTDSAVSYVKLASVPAAIRNLLVSGKEIVKKYDRTKYYFYFNFSSTENAAYFIKNYKTLLGTNAPDIDANLTGTSGAGTEVIVNGTVQTIGAVATANGTNVAFNAANPADATATSVNQTNYGNRFELMSHLLMAIEDESKIIYEKTAAGADGKSLSLGYFGVMPTANYVIESELTNQSGTNEEITVTDGSNTYKVHVIYTTGDITVSGLNDSETYLIVTLGNATVNGGFKGLLMAEGSISVASNVTISAAPETIRKFLELNPKSADNKEVNKVFETYKTSEENTDDDINRVQYSDVLELSNWRKY